MARRKLRILFNSSVTPLTTAKINAICDREDMVFVALTSLPARRANHIERTYSAHCVLRSHNGAEFKAYGISRQGLYVKEAQGFLDPLVGARIGGAYDPQTHSFAYSTYRHDFHQPVGFPCAVDGGRDYVRLVGNVHAVQAAYFDLKRLAVCAGYYSDTSLDFDNPTILGYVDDGQFRKTRKKA